MVVAAMKKFAVFGFSCVGSEQHVTSCSMGVLFRIALFQQLLRDKKQLRNKSSQ